MSRYYYYPNFHMQQQKPMEDKLLTQVLPEPMKLQLKIMRSNCRAQTIDHCTVHRT